MSSSPNSSSSSSGPLPQGDRPAPGAGGGDPGQAAESPAARPASDAQAGSLGPWLDVRCPVSVVLGSGTISVRECLALGPRSVVRLEQAAGEDVQVVIGEIPVARAEVVIVADNTAVRLTEVLRPIAREAK